MLKYFKVKVLKSNHILSTVNYLAADDILLFIAVIC